MFKNGLHLFNDYFIATVLMSVSMKVCVESWYVTFGCRRLGATVWVPPFGCSLFGRLDV